MVETRNEGSSTGRVTFLDPLNTDENVDEALIAVEVGIGGFCALVATGLLTVAAAGFILLVSDFLVEASDLPLGRAMAAAAMSAAAAKAICLPVDSPRSLVAPVFWVPVSVPKSGLPLSVDQNADGFSDVAVRAVDAVLG